MGIKAEGWGNKKGTSNRECNCGSWKKHWLNESKKSALRVFAWNA